MANFTGVGLVPFVAWPNVVLVIVLTDCEDEDTTPAASTSLLSQDLEWLISVPLTSAVPRSLVNKIKYSKSGDISLHSLVTYALHIHASPCALWQKSLFKSFQTFQGQNPKIRVLTVAVCLTYGSRAECTVGVAASRSISRESCSLLERSDEAIAPATTPSPSSTSVGEPTGPGHWLDRTLVTATLCVFPYRSTTANTRCRGQTVSSRHCEKIS